MLSVASLFIILAEHRPVNFSKGNLDDQRLD